MFNRMKMGVKLAGVFAIIFVVVTAMMLSGAAVRMKALRILDSSYRQYVEDIKSIGKIQTGLEKMEKDLYLYVTVPSVRQNILSGIQEETNSIDKMVQILKSKREIPRK